mmetsp:Transcript_39149/g.54353  ORF Transcript_39149/g.54353 Transcript_39149/m.54353 type:complete len:817 (+) Transcript_39149:48-2498(+)|eukprot:CAMPEP_0196572460 /NCGR_PEP_ID=MMETSP1081-20130531/2509_1 /TAXON_ID=36882 /ORGANISM="Pyramimonas amylifera, Strain CCMP720" /LENGTH=816 /DNA_ID=CAMNT_0041889795 /DNA_START=46 /DNA_END=2496 /DNA_ORIENTATION=-
MGNFGKPYLQGSKKTANRSSLDNVTSWIEHHNSTGVEPTVFDRPQPSHLPDISKGVQNRYNGGSGTPTRSLNSRHTPQLAIKNKCTVSLDLVQSQRTQVAHNQEGSSSADWNRQPALKSVKEESQNTKEISKFVTARRVAVYNARGHSTIVTSSNATKSSERRLPGDGGPAAPRAHRDVQVIAKACDGISIFQGIHKEDRRALYESMYQLEYQPGENIVCQGEDGRNFYVIVQGSPVVRSMKEHAKGDVQHRMYPGQTFGEIALLHACPRSATVTCVDSKVKVWALDCVTFKQLLSKSAFNRRARFVQILARVPLLSPLKEYNRQQLADALMPMSFQQGDVIIVQGQVESARFHMVERGHVSVQLADGRVVNRLGEGSYFGEVTLLGLDPPTATVVAETETETLTLDRASFQRLLGSDAVKASFSQSMKTYVFDEAGENALTRFGRQSFMALFNGTTNGIRALFKPLAGLGELGSNRRSHETGLEPKEQMEGDHGIGEGMTRADLEFIKELGMGMSAKVYLCRIPKLDNRLVVVKMMKKSNIIQLLQVENVLREKSILSCFQSRFIVGCYGSFQDQDYLYLILEHMAGGELFSLLVELNVVPASMARMFAAEVLLGLEFMHRNGLVYRDLKPENMLITRGGHIKIADLGFCKPLERGEKTYTTCGTADYMAPEVMLCQGHDKAADLWAFGVFIFEMLAGRAPFESQSDSERYNKILRGQVHFPEDFNLLAKDIVSKLCVVDISRRLGCTAEGIKEIKQHPFFADLDWVALEEGRILALHHPKITPTELYMRAKAFRVNDGGNDPLTLDQQKQFEFF